MQIYGNTLTKDSVSIQSDEYGTRAYVNSVRGRAQFEAECSPEIVQEIYEAWGDKPTVTEPTYPTQNIDPQPTEQEKINASIMLEIAKLKAGA